MALTYRARRRVRHRPLFGVERRAEDEAVLCREEGVCVITAVGGKHLNSTFSVCTRNIRTDSCFYCAFSRPFGLFKKQNKKKKTLFAPNST